MRAFFTPISVSVAPGTAPFVTGSSQVCSNFNADLLDGFHATQFIDVSSSTQTKSGSLIVTGTFQSSLNIEAKTTFTPTTTGWYRVISATNQSSGRIVIRGSYNGKYADVEFLFAVNGYGNSGTITQLNLPDYYSGGSIVTQARISSDGSANIYLDIYVSDATSPSLLTVYGYGPELFGIVSSPVVGASAGSSNVSTITFQKGLVTTQSVVAALFSGAGTGLTGNATSLSIGGNAATATSISGGSTGDLLYQSTSATTAKLAIGPTGSLLQSSGTLPTWSTLASITVGGASNVSGGAAGSMPYQSGPGATIFLSIGAANSVLTSNGSSPQWSSSLALSGNISLGGATSLISINGNGSGGSQIQVPGGGNSMFSVLSSSGSVYLGTNVYYNGSSWTQSAYGGSANSSLIGFTPGTGALWWASSNSSSSWNVANGASLWDSTGKWTGSLNASAGAQVNGSTIITAGSGTSLASTNIAGGASGSLPYQSGPGATTFLGIGVASQVLTVNVGATAPQWTSQSSLSVGTAGIATNISGGATGDLLYQSAGATTSKLPIGAVSTVLQSSGTLPTWSTLASLTVGAATNISGGLAGDVLYQSAVGVTSKLSIGSANLALTSNGSVPVWGQISLTAGVSGTLPIANGGTGLSIAAQSTALLGPTSGAGAPTWRLLLFGDLPSNLVRKYTQSVGDNYASSFAVVHNFGTKDVEVSIRRNSDDVIANYASTITATSTSTVTVVFASIPAASQYTVTVMG